MVYQGCFTCQNMYQMGSGMRRCRADGLPMRDAYMSEEDSRYYSCSMYAADRELIQKEKNERTL